MNLSFQISNDFINSYRSKDEPFGFNGLGAMVYTRTYSRIKEDGTKEVWVDTCERVINGMYSVLKDHCLENNRPWNEVTGQRSSQEAFDGLFNLKWSPSGRGLWVMGVPFVHERGVVEALQNCAAISTQNIKEERGDIFNWFMEMLMLGVGVGFDVRGSGTLEITGPDLSKDVSIYIIPDNREGWAKGIEVLFNSYVDVNSQPVLFDYSLIRKKGAPIKGFGGVSSGYEPLEMLYEESRRVLDKNIGAPITTRTIADIFNLIGVMVVSGNVRRSAEIALGESGDEEFENLKNYDINPDRESFGWSSNNSILAKIGQDYTSQVDRMYENGEPGFVWLENINNYARMNGVKDTDDKAILVNPCQPGYATLLTPDGIKTFNDIGVGSVIWGKSDWTTVTAKWSTGIKTVYNYVSEFGEFLGTENHRVVQNGEKVTASTAHHFDSMTIITPGNKPLIVSGALVRVEPRGDMEVFDITVDNDEHVYWTGGVIVSNCGEQPLEAGGEMCNLVELYPHRNENLYDYARSIKFAYLYGKAVTLLSKHIRDDTSREVMMRNRRIGLSNTGITQFIAKNGTAELINWLEYGYSEVERYDKVYSHWLGINKSVRKTTSKPSGTCSLLSGSTPGVHYPMSEYYIRRVRLAKNSDLVVELLAHGYKIEDDVVASDTVVVEFPIHAGNNIRSEKDVSIWEQLETASLIQKHWADNSVSVTIKFNPKKVSKAELASSIDFYQHKLKTVSFLPQLEDGAYAQMPYEEITKEEYEEMMKSISVATLIHADHDASTEDKYCENDSCEVDFSASVIQGGSGNEQNIQEAIYEKQEV